MIRIKFSDSQLAYTFADYMSMKGIPLMVEQGEQGEAILVLQQDHYLEQVKHELHQFQQNPYDDKYSEASWQNASQSSKKITENTVRYNPKSLFNIRAGGLLTVVVTIICVAMFIALLTLGTPSILIYLGYPVSANYYSQFWRFITPIFIHFSILHIVFNLSWWWYLGNMIEARLSWKKLLEITLLSGLISNFCENLMTGPYFGGLSGVVYALIGYVWLYGEKRPQSLIGIDRVMVIFAVLWLIAGFFGFIGSVANTAHLVGLLVGLLLALKDTLFNKVSSN